MTHSTDNISNFNSVCTLIRNREWNALEQGINRFKGLTDSRSRSPLIACVEENNYEGVQEIFKRPILLNVLSNGKPYLALHSAAYKGSKKIVLFLLGKGLSLQRKDGNEKTPFYTALDADQLDIVEIFFHRLKGTISPYQLTFGSSSLPFSPLAYSVMHGKIKCLDFFLSQDKIKLNTYVEKTGNLLHIAIQFGQEVALKRLLQKHLPTLPTPTQYFLLEGRNHLGQTPISLAASLGATRSLSLLTQRGVSPETPDFQKRSPLHWAAKGRHLEIIRMLTPLVRNPEPNDIDGKRPFDLLKGQKDYYSIATRNLIENLANRQKRKKYTSLNFLTHLPQNLIFKMDDPTAAIGVIQYFQDIDMLKTIKRFAGISKGAIIATLLAVGCRANEIKNLLFSPKKEKAIDLERIEQEIHKKTNIKNCTFEQLRHLIEKGKSYTHLHIFAAKPGHTTVRFTSEGGKRDKTPIVKALSAAVSISRKLQKSTLFTKVFDRYRYLYPNLNQDEGKRPTFNRETLVFTFQSDASPIPRVINIPSLKKSSLITHAKTVVTEAFEKMKKQAQQTFSTIKKELIYLTRRSELLTRLNKKYSNLKNLRDRRVLFTLCGPPGSGKTELAKSFIEEHINDFSHIHWIDCLTPQKRLDSYRLLAFALDLHPPKNPTCKKFEEAIFHYLVNTTFTKPWFLVFDNVWEKLSNLPTRNGFILITSKREDLWQLQETIHMPPFHQKQVAEVIKNTLDKKDHSQANALIAKKDSFPLTIAKVISSIKAKKQSDILTYRGGRYFPSIKQAWKPIFSHVHKKNTYALPWLRTCAQLYNRPILNSWVAKWLVLKEKSNLHDCRRKARDCLNVLKNYHLIAEQNASHTLNKIAHRLLRSGKTPETLINIGLHLQSIDKTKEAIRYYKEALKEYKDSDKIAKTHNLIGLALGKTKEALSHHQKALDLYKKIHNKKPHISIAYTHYLIGNTQNPQQALVSYCGALSTIWKVGKNHKDTQTYLKALLKTAKNVPTQLTLNILHLVLKRAKKIYSSEYHPKVVEITNTIRTVRKEIVKTLNQQAKFAQTKNNHQKALEFYQEALAINQTLYSSNPRIAENLDNIGLCLKSLGKLQEALPYFQEALEIIKKTAGDEPDPKQAIYNKHYTNALITLIGQQVKKEAT